MYSVYMWYKVYVDVRDIIGVFISHLYNITLLCISYYVSTCVCAYGHTYISVLKSNTNREETWKFSEQTRAG